MKGKQRVKKSNKVAYNYYDTTVISKETLPWVTSEECIRAARNTVMDNQRRHIKTVEGRFTHSLNHGRNYFNQVISTRHIPTIDEFIQAYWKINRNTLSEHHHKYYEHLNDAEFKSGVEARCYRAGLGFLTELHAYTLSEEFFANYTLYKTIKLDSSGIDWVLETPENIFAVRFYVNTARAKAFAAGKLENFNKNKKISVVNLTYNWDDPGVTTLDNGFVLCNNYHMLKLKSVIDGKIKPDISLNFYSV